MPLFLRLFFLLTGFFLVAVMGFAFIGVFDTWRFYSLPLAQAMVLEVIIATIAVAGAWIAAAAIRYRDPRKVKKTKPPRWPYKSFSNTP